MTDFLITTVCWYNGLYCCFSQFFKVGNYLGAISAYSHAINAGSKMPALYSNRAAAHMALGNLHKTVEDCSTVSTHIVPWVFFIAHDTTSYAQCFMVRVITLM